MCSSFCAEAYAVLQALCWSRELQEVGNFSFLLLLSNFQSVLVTLFPPPSLLLHQTFWKIWQELSSFYSFTIRLQWVPGHSLLLGNKTADGLAKWDAILLPTAIPCGLFSPTSCNHSSLSRTGCVVPDLNSSTHKYSLCLLRNLCFLVMLAMSSLVFAASDTSFFKTLSL